MKAPKSKKTKHKQAHVASTDVGQGDFYGRGPYPTRGKIRHMNLPGMNPVSPKNLKKPPKSLA